MAHYAFLDENNIVTEVIVGKEETELLDGLDPQTWYGNFREQTCLRTSYNGNIRKNFAGVGFIYDAAGDAFYAPQPYPSWKLDRRSFTWKAPVAMPTDGKVYAWDEAGQMWNEVSI